MSQFVGFFYFMLLDRVFGPTTTTRHVYDVAAQHVISGAMEGINGKLFKSLVTNFSLFSACHKCSNILS